MCFVWRMLCFYSTAFILSSSSVSISFSCFMSSNTQLVLWVTISRVWYSVLFMVLYQVIHYLPHTLVSQCDLGDIFNLQSLGICMFLDCGLETGLTPCKHGRTCKLLSEWPSVWPRMIWTIWLSIGQQVGPLLALLHKSYWRNRVKSAAGPASVCI